MIYLLSKFIFTIYMEKIEKIIIAISYIYIVPLIILAAIIASPCLLYMWILEKLEKRS